MLPSLGQVRWLALILVALLVGVMPADAQTQPEVQRAQVVDVIGQFCKLNVPATAGVQVGDLGTLHRLTSGNEPLATITITAVEREYTVGRVTGQEPRLGDYVLIVLREKQPKPEPAPTPEPIAERSPTANIAEPAGPIDQLDAAVGALIDVEPKKGNTLHDVKLLRVTRDSETNEARLLRVEQSNQKQWTIGLPSVARVLRDGEVIYTPPSAPAEVKSSSSAASPKREEKKEGKEEEPADEKPKTRNQLLAERRAKREAEEREKWLARLEVRGIEPWPVLTDEEHQAAVDELKELVKKVIAQFPDMMLHETENFLVCTNIPPQQVGPYVVSLDSMHAMLSKMYGVDPKHRVWRGKALVVAFLHQAQFIQFEQQFMQHQPGPETYGLCHQKSTGEVIMACYRGDRAADFGHMLVHETSHGFIHRYKTPVQLPTWVNEGMAEWIGQALVPASQAVRNSQQAAIQRMQQTRSMGNLLTAPAGIDTWQYGVASSLNDFMIRSNQKAYVAFIEGLKEGLDWRDSLQQSYNVTPEQLIAAYGRTIGIPDLQP